MEDSELKLQGEVTISGNLLNIENKANFLTLLAAILLCISLGFMFGPALTFLSGALLCAGASLYLKREEWFKPNEGRS